MSPDPIEALVYTRRHEEPLAKPKGVDEGRQLLRREERGEPSSSRKGGRSGKGKAIALARMKRGSERSASEASARVCANAEAEAQGIDRPISGRS